MIIDKSKIKTIDIKKPLQLESGQVLDGFTVAYETFGTLNKNKDNAILVFHALSGDQFATGTNPITGKDGWWVTAIGPNKIIVTILCDVGTRYASRLFNREFLKSKGLPCPDWIK